VRHEAWSPRSWFLPWLGSGLAIFHLSRTQPALAPAVLGLLLLAWVPWRRTPLPFPRILPWLLLLPFGLWWMVLVAEGKAAPVQLAAIPAWYLGLLAVLQVLGGERFGAWRSWNGLSAVLLAGFDPDPGQVVLVVVLCATILLQARHVASNNGASRFRAMWSAGALAACGVALLPLWIRVDLPLGVFDGMRTGPVRKGFSSSLRLGSGFGLDPDPSDDDVVLRAWSMRRPEYFKGAVFDVYHQGAWSRSERWDHPASSRNVLDFSVFCLESDTLAPPTGWAVASAPTEGYLLIPPEAGCVGAVADSLRRASSGVWAFVGNQNIDRGWMWLPGTVPRRVLASERGVPEELAPLLDSILAGIHIPGATAGDVTGALGRWFAASFRYSLQIEEPRGEDPVRAFLRERAGFCEHFATAGVLLARRAGVPARVVTGYAYPEPSAGAWILRRSNAHAWVEVFDSTRGWTAWDPTPASATAPLARGSWRRWRDDLGTRLGRAWHLLRDGAWRTVLADRLEASTRASATGPVAIAGGLLAVAGLLWLGARALRRRRGRDARRWEERLRRAEDALRKEGQVRAAGETVGRFLSRLPRESSATARTELEAYQRERWRDS